MGFAIDLRALPHGPALAMSHRQQRLFAITLAASVALHLAAIVMSPRLQRPDETPPRPLQVEIVRPPAPQPLRPPERVSPPPQTAKPVVRPQPEQTKRKPAPVPEQRLLALPDPGPSAPSTFSVPQASLEPPPSAAPESRAAVPAPPREVPATPPSFNAAYLRNAPPRYPLMARRNGVEGTVRLKVFVSRDGKPAQVQLDSSSGSAALDNAALEAVRTWQFVPARKGQEAVESWVLVPVVFRLEGAT